MSWCHPCAGGIWLGGGGKNGGDGGVCRWICFCGCNRRRGAVSCAGGIWFEESGVIRVPVGFGLAEVARMEVTAACAGENCFSAEVTGGAGGRVLVLVGFGPQARSDTEARSFVCRWGLAPRKQRECGIEVTAASADATSVEVTGGGGRVPVGFAPRRSNNEARSSVRRWDLAAGKQRE